MEASAPIPSVRGNIRVRLQRLHSKLCMMEGARFENVDGGENIDRDLLSSFSSQSVTEESEEGREPIKTDGER